MIKTWMGLCLLAWFLIGCDPAHKEQCEWYLIPEPKNIDMVPEGWVPLCARNFVTVKQRCHLKASLDFAKAVHNKTFRLSALKVDDTGPYPREVLKIKTCEPSDEEVARLAKEK